MPIDPMLADPMLMTYRNMMQEIEDKGVTGEYRDTMRSTLDRMEQLVQELDDINTLTGTMMNENLYVKFSDAYGRCLGALGGAGEKQNPDDYDDGALLTQNLDALRESIRAIKAGKQEAIDISNSHNAEENAAYTIDYLSRNQQQMGTNFSDGELKQMKSTATKAAKKKQQQNPEYYSNAQEIDVLFNEQKLIQPIEEVIALGEQPGMTFPRYLRIQIEKGLDKAMEGSSLTRDTLEFQLGQIRSNPSSPYQLEETQKVLDGFNTLAAAAPFGVPDSLEFNLLWNKIEHEYAPIYAKWEAIKRKWEQIISRLDEWITAHTRFAPYMYPWELITDPAAKRKAIEQSQDCMPGELKVLERMFHDYFGLTVNDIWTHETFVHEVQYDYLTESQEYITFLRDKVYPACQPFQHPNSALIAECERLYENKLMTNPNVHNVGERLKNHYNNTFGEGRYEAKYGTISRTESNAAPWNLASFNA